MWPVTPPTDTEQVSQWRLLTSCADRPGIVAAISQLLYDIGANIVSSDQYSSDPSGGAFFMRVEFHLAMDGAARAALEHRIEEAAKPLELDWHLWPANQPKRIAVLVSRSDHCLLELLWRWRRGQLNGEVCFVASNHPDLEQEVHGFGVPFHHIPISAQTKPQAEAALLELLGGVDLLVLARYMQILSPSFLAQCAVPAINIHHSFLPAFAGANPYERAKERGVKLIGATAHYVTEELDAGPIIEQDVIRVSHAHTVAALTQFGADIERMVLARAVTWHCEDRVLRDGNSTIVF
jgi:formyltetrahydrofolate deformylase